MEIPPPFFVSMEATYKDDCQLGEVLMGRSDVKDIPSYSLYLVSDNIADYQADSIV